eukprot:scaffold406156_cov31-Attheya_sp.AAC.1
MPSRLEEERKRERAASQGGRTAPLSRLNQQEGGRESQRAASHVRRTAPLSRPNQQEGER